MNTNGKPKEDELELEEQGVPYVTGAPGLPEGLTLYKADAGSKNTNNTGGSAGGSYSYEQSAPSYKNRYQSVMDQAAAALLSRPAFTYDHNTDPMYQQYKDSYTRQGQQAMEDTLAQVSARTGGLASSYATSASQQTYNNYMSALADKVPELRQLAYQMYMDEGDTLRANLQMLQGLEATDYGRYRDQVADNQWQQTFDTQNSQWQQKFDYDKNLAAAQLMGEAGDYSGYQGMFDLSDEQVASLQEYNEKGDKLAAAQLLAQAGDYSGYQALLGLTNEQVATLSANHNSGKLLAAAELMAQAGDFSGYKAALNLTDEQVATLEAWYQKQNAPKVATSGGGGTGFDNGGRTPEEIKKMQAYYGLTADGKWGPNSQKITGMSADEAWAKYTGGTYGFPALDSGGGDERIVAQAKAFVNEHPDIAWNSRTVDYYLEDSGLTGEERALFKEYLKTYGATWGTNAK